MSFSNHKVSIKRQMTTIIVGAAMLAITSAMPASATVSNTNGQNLTSEQQSTQLLAAKKGEPSKGGHSKNKRPSTLEKHQDAEAQRNQDQVKNPGFKEYRKNGGRLSKDTWEKQGMPKK